MSSANGGDQSGRSRSIRPAHDAKPKSARPAAGQRATPASRSRGQPLPCPATAFEQVRRTARAEAAAPDSTTRRARTVGSRCQRRAWRRHSPPPTRRAATMTSRNPAGVLAAPSSNCRAEQHDAGRRDAGTNQALHGTAGRRRYDEPRWIVKNTCTWMTSDGVLRASHFMPRNEGRTGRRDGEAIHDDESPRALWPTNEEHQRNAAKKARSAASANSRINAGRPDRHRRKAEERDDGDRQREMRGERWNSSGVQPF